MERYNFFGKLKILYSFDNGKHYFPIIEGFTYYPQFFLYTISTNFLPKSQETSLVFKGFDLMGNFSNANLTCRIKNQYFKAIFMSMTHAKCLFKNFDKLNINKKSHKNFSVEFSENGEDFYEKKKFFVNFYDLSNVNPNVLSMNKEILVIFLKKLIYLNIYL